MPLPTGPFQFSPSNSANSSEKAQDDDEDDDEPFYQDGCQENHACTEEVAPRNNNQINSTYISAFDVSDGGPGKHSFSGPPPRGGILEALAAANRWLNILPQLTEPQLMLPRT